MLRAIAHAALSHIDQLVAEGAMRVHTPPEEGLATMPLNDSSDGGQDAEACRALGDVPACHCWPEIELRGFDRIREVVPAEPGAVRLLRRRMRRWVEAIGLEDELAESVVLIVDEAVTNAVEHACPGRDCHVTLIAGPRSCGGGIAVLVSDDGEWQQITQPGYRGRGITLVGQLSDRSSIEAGVRGTAVRMCWAAATQSPTP